MEYSHIQELKVWRCLRQVVSAVDSYSNDHRQWFRSSQDQTVSSLLFLSVNISGVRQRQTINLAPHGKKEIIRSERSTTISTYLCSAPAGGLEEMVCKKTYVHKIRYLFSISICYNWADLLAGPHGGSRAPLTLEIMWRYNWWSHVPESTHHTKS